MRTPAISVLMSVRNGMPWIAEAVESMLQAFADFELIVVDDGSADSTGVILDECRDPRLPAIHQSTAGLTCATRHAAARPGHAEGRSLHLVGAHTRPGRAVLVLTAHPPFAWVIRVT